MSVPKFYEFFKAFLQAISDGEQHSAKDVRQSVSDEMHLSEIDLTEMLPSKRQTTFANRVAWARTYLDKAGLIETPVRGHYRITDEGRKALKSGEVIDLSYLEKYKSFTDFQKTSKKEQKPSEENNEQSPQEALDSAFVQINNVLASELMEEIMKLSSVEFEKLVVKLLLKMGYGDGIDDAGIVTPPTKDGGIDGIIKEDQLGFSNICIQAKQWSVDQTVSTPEVQKFAGALQGQQAQKGLFITTAKFSKGAQEYARNISGSKIVLVDGTTLTKLMIKHNLGVSTEQVYEVKRIDSDFFGEEL